MKGVGRGWGAITLVNALATGVGCAATIDLPTDVSLDVETSDDGRLNVSIEGGGDTPLARATLREALAALAPSQGLDAHAVVRSAIPAGRGLKSSSALGVALVRSAAAALGRPVAPLAAARLAARVAREIRQSATGAFDDAMAATGAGIIVTQNDSAEVLRSATPDGTWRAVLWVPPGDHTPSVDWLPTFREHRSEGAKASDLAHRGDFLSAMRENTELVERLMGYPYASLRVELATAGALASGVSGMGPSLAAIVPEDRAAVVAGVLPRDQGRVQIVDFVRPSHRTGGPK